MKRTLILLFLCICILTTSMLAKYGLSQEYLMRPYAYFERITTVFDNTPSADDVEITFNVFESEEYVSLGLELPVWQSVSFDGITDVVPALRTFMNNIGNYVSAIAKQSLSVTPKLWHNFVVLAKNAVSLVPKVIVYVGKTLVNVFKMKGFVITAVMSLVPLDWERMQEDGVEIKLFFFGNLGEIPFSKYYGIVTEDDIDPPTVDTDTGTNTGGFELPDDGLITLPSVPVVPADPALPDPTPSPV